jgi:hypothetical protein
MWGADMLNVERSDTYLQSLDYLRKHCTFISAGDLDTILANADTICFSIEPQGIFKGAG